MIFDAIDQDPELFSIRRRDVSENGIRISFEDRLLTEDGELKDERVIILKLDDYHLYNSRHTHNPPKVVDNLIVIKCCDEMLRLVFVELRHSNGKRPIRRLNPKEIEEKFETALNDFVETKHPDLFPQRLIKSVKAYLVADPWRFSERDNASELFDSKIKLCALDAYGSRPPLRIFGRNVLINPIMPPNPVIGLCRRECA